MGNTIYNFGTYNDHHTDNSKHITANVSSSSDLNRLMHNFFNDNAEDIQADEFKPDEPTVAENATAEPNPQKTLPFFVPQKLEELGTYTTDEFEVLYHNAVRNNAKSLAAFLKRYRDLEVLDIKDREKTEIFYGLKSYFHEELKFGYTNFTIYY